MADNSLDLQKKNYHHGDLRGALIEAVRQLIERDGADKFKIAEACRIAGVSTAAPYKHFKDRSDILHGVALAAMGRLYEAMMKAAGSYPAGDIRRIVAMGEAYTGFARAEPGVFRLVFGLTEDHDGDDQLMAAGDMAQSLVEQVVAEHVRSTPDDPVVQLRAYALWCFVHGHSFLTVDGKRAKHAGDLDERALLQLVGDGMVPDPDGLPNSQSHDN